MRRLKLSSVGERNLRAMYDRADMIDREEGLLAYARYHQLMARISDKYKILLPRVVAGFVSLSPNSDYVGNLRSLISVLEGIKDGKSLSDITVSTYRHCRDRAHAYIIGTAQFEARTKGPKVLSFYRNIVDPTDNRWVTVDGHIVATYRALPLTMKQAILRQRSEYDEIAHAIKRLAFDAFVLPCQYQATIWFTRKRVLGVKYDAQTDIFYQGDAWKTFQNLDDIKPYPFTRRIVQSRSSRRNMGVRAQSSFIPD